MKVPLAWAEYKGRSGYTEFWAGTSGIVFGTNCSLALTPRQTRGLLQNMTVEYRKDSAGILTDGPVGSCQFLLAF